VCHPRIQPCHSGSFSLAIPLWVGSRSGDGIDRRLERNGEFCVAVGLLPTGLLIYWLYQLNALGVNPFMPNF